MLVGLLSYDLPADRIAQEPTPDRENAKLLVVRQGALENHLVRDLADVMPDRSLLVLNDTRVLPARLFAVKPTGGRVEIFLVRAAGTRTLEAFGREVVADVWQALGKGSKALRFGIDMRIVGDGKALWARLIERRESDGLLSVAFFCDGGVTADAMRALGHMPLPPYIKRGATAADEERYQTVYARVDGAIAAPTAGLHLSRALLDRLAAKGCDTASITLHVGLGTFQPVIAPDLDQHTMHSERLSVSQSTADAIAAARAEGRPIVAIGTTVVRALESVAKDDGAVAPFDGETALLIQPGYRFRVVDHLFTNFHLPRSTLLALVCAFGGMERVLAAYRYAVEHHYRFYSYGDAMFVSRDMRPS